MCARSGRSVLWRGRGERLRLPLPQQDIDTGAPGAVVVNGADQSGTSLDVTGGTPYALIRKGWFVTIETDGVGRLHIVTAETILDADSTGTLSLWPMLRVPPADGDTVEIVEPYIEGYRAEGGEIGSGLTRSARPGAFVIEEQD